MKRSIAGLAVLGCISLILLSTTAFAHDGEWGDANNPTEFTDLGTTGELDFIHEDQDPFKGWATIWFLNLCGDDWGDFHLKLLGLDSANVDFISDGLHDPQIWVYTLGSGLEQITDLTPVISEDGGQLDLYFYDNPIERLSVGCIKVYTDNTSHCSSFTVKAYPTPVPEPTTIALLGFGAMALFRRRKR